MLGFPSSTICLIFCKIDLPDIITLFLNKYAYYVNILKCTKRKKGRFFLYTSTVCMLEIYLKKVYFTIPMCLHIRFTNRGKDGK